MQSEAETKNEIMSVLEKYMEAYTEKNLNSLMDIVSKDEDTIFVGTGYDEWAHGPKEIKEGFQRDLTQADSIKIEFHKLPISSAGKVAWTATKMTMKVLADGEELVLDGRLSAVFEKRNYKWVIVHLHYSLPVKEQEKGQSYPQ
ncbi:MAG: nuclear transport factor 2 family protein [Methanobacteriaceae archaeon]|nr:nuclear transport factor 2 family protein [Methanobacteriaceae archaeon]